MTPVALPVDVRAYLSWESDTAGKTTGVTVLDAQPATPDQIGLDTIDLTTLAVTVDVPRLQRASPGPPASVPAGSLQSTSLARYPGLAYASPAGTSIPA